MRHILVLLCSVADPVLGACRASRGSIWFVPFELVMFLVVIPAQVMQSQMIGMQSSLDRILSAVQTQSAGPQPAYPPRDGPEFEARNSFEGNGTAPERRAFPPLPGFAPPVMLTLLCRRQAPANIGCSPISTRLMGSSPALHRHRMTSRRIPSRAPPSTRPSRLSKVWPMPLPRPLRYLQHLLRGKFPSVSTSFISHPSQS